MCFVYILGEAAVYELFYLRFTFKLSFFFRVFQHGSGASFKAIIPLSVTLPLAIGLKNFGFLIALLSYAKSVILGLSFLDPKDLCLKHSVCTYLTSCQTKNWVASMIELTLIFNASYVCHYKNIFWSASFVKFPWRCWTEISQSWKDLRKTLQSHENLRSLTDLNGANIGFCSISRDRLFWMFMMPKNQSINQQKRTVSAASGGKYVNRILLTKLSTWAASLPFLFCVRGQLNMFIWNFWENVWKNSALYFHKK